VSVEVANTGSVAGDEIVQCYLHQKVSSATRPVKELKDFARIHLKPGEAKTVSFQIDAAKLAFWTARMTYDVEPGVFEAMVGRSSADTSTVTFKVSE
jgi:beta-glucosidase